MGAQVTGLVFDLPHAPWWSDVLRLRAAWAPGHLKFPVEITVVGSSGLGWFAGHQASRELEEAVRGVAARCKPFEFRFAGVERFANSNVYYLAVADERPFHDFQRELARCGLAFEPTPFSYKPHCTIAILDGNAGDTAHAQLQACPVPDHAILISSVSLYRVDHERGEALQGTRIALGA